MTLTHETVGNVLVVEPLMSSLDAVTGEAFRLEVESHVEAEGEVVFDLHRVDLVDSAGLATILSCLKHVVALGGDLKLCALTPRVQDMVERARMLQVVEIHATREEAVDSYA